MKNEKPGGSKRLRLDDAGRYVTNANIEENLLEWIFKQCSNDIRVSRKLIIIKVNLKTTGHEKEKVTICLIATADGNKKKPFLSSLGQNAK